MHAKGLLSSVAIRPNLELKIQPKHILGPLPLDIVLPAANSNLIEVDILQTNMPWPIYFS